MPMEAALHEAKQWLRGLDRQEVAALLVGLGARDRGPRRLRTAGPEHSSKPFAAPYYWAMFVLIGAPD